MAKNIESSTYFSSGIQPAANGVSLLNPIRVIPTPFMPTLITMGITFIISGLNNEPGQTYQVELKRKDSGEIIFRSKKESLRNVNPHNTVINVNLENAQFKQKNGGDYEATIEIKNENSEQIFLGKGTFSIIKTE
ncbi:MAG: hypothetical protein J6565_07630 [Lactobacillus sp.]|nr:hypothetical protein [Lactobacillus sp.]